MMTKFEIGQTVWYLDIAKDEILAAKVKRIIIEPEVGDIYQLGEEGMLCPGRCLFSAKESCRAHYLQKLK